MNRNKIVYSGYTFEGDDIEGGSIYLAASLLSSKLEANTFAATVRSGDPTLTDFQRNTPLIYFYAGEQLGRFYVQDISRVGPNLYRVSATSAIGLLIEGQHYGGIYTGQTVEEILPSICGTVPYIVKDNLLGIKLYGWLPVAAPRDNLSQVLFAIGATVKTDMDGVLRIEGLWNGLSGALPRSRLYQGATVDYTAKVTQVAVTEHQYVEGGDEKQLFEGTAQAGDIVIFSEPMYDLTATGFTILERGANYAKVSAGSGTLSGLAYIHNTRQITRQVASAAEPNIKTVEDATLVSLVNSTAIAERLVNYFRCVQAINAKATYAGEIPGDLLAEWHPYDNETVSVCLQSAEITMSNALAAQEKALVGFEPLQSKEVNYFDEKIILTGSGNWTVPKNVENIRIILIGGGNGGENGAKGKNSIFTSSSSDTSYNYTSKTFTSVNDTATVSSTNNRPALSPGEGGAGGNAGSAGKVLDLSLDVSEGMQFLFNCGVGGDPNGGIGGETEFGSYSSASGTAGSGFVDVTTGIMYAKPGVPGTNGGKGGSAGSPGESVSSVSGGSSTSAFSDSKTASVSNYPSSNVTYRTTGDETISIGAAGGGGAGGSSGTVSGKAGSSAIRGSSGGVSCSGFVATIRGTASTGGNGGAGANGENGNTYGSGGNGGGGGGGAGATGFINISGKTTITMEKLTISSFEVRSSIACEVKAYQSAGTGGNGGQGGSGAPGCIIIYYSRKESPTTGALMDKNHKIILDKHGRLIVA